MCDQSSFSIDTADLLCLTSVFSFCFQRSIRNRFDLGRSCLQEARSHSNWYRRLRGTSTEHHGHRQWTENRRLPRLCHDRSAKEECRNALGVSRQSGHETSTMSRTGVQLATRIPRNAIYLRMDHRSQMAIEIGWHWEICHVCRRSSSTTYVDWSGYLRHWRTLETCNYRCRRVSQSWSEHRWISTGNVRRNRSSHP